MEEIGSFFKKNDEKHVKKAQQCPKDVNTEEGEGSIDPELLFGNQATSEVLKEHTRERTEVERHYKKQVMPQQRNSTDAQWKRHPQYQDCIPTVADGVTEAFREQLQEEASRKHNNHSTQIQELKEKKEMREKYFFSEKEEAAEAMKIKEEEMKKQGAVRESKYYADAYEHRWAMAKQEEVPSLLLCDVEATEVESVALLIAQGGEDILWTSYMQEMFVSDETLMRQDIIMLQHVFRLVKGIGTVLGPWPHWNEKEPLSKWKGIEMHENKNAFNRVLSFSCEQFHRCDEVASIRWSMLPRLIQHLDLSNIGFIGGMNCGLLPFQLRTLSVKNNRLEGPLDLTVLPPFLQEMDCSMNCLGGSIDLSCLPDSLRVLNLSNNYFSGQLCLSAIPTYCCSLISLHLGNNQFNGPLDLSKLPDRLEELRLNSNNFNGVFDWTCMKNGAPSLRHLDLRKNVHLRGELNLSSLPPKLCSLDVRHNSFTSPSIIIDHENHKKSTAENDEEGEDASAAKISFQSLPSSLTSLSLDHNQFTGPMDLQELQGSGLKELSLVGNKINIISPPPPGLKLKIDSKMLSMKRR